jgi:hypothetical protein
MLSEAEGSRAIFSGAGADFWAICGCLVLALLLTYCQVNGNKPTPNTSTAATDVQAGQVKLEVVLLRVGNAMTSAEYSSRAVAKSKSCSRLS